MSQKSKIDKQLFDCLSRLAVRQVHPEIAQPEIPDRHFLIELLSLAEIHRLHPLVWKIGKQRFSDIAHDPEFHQFQQHCRGDMRIALIQDQAVNKLRETFRQQSIRHAFLKGVVYRHLFYSDVALRPMFDIDVLIHPDDFERSKNMLLNRGYHARNASRRTLRQGQDFPMAIGSMLLDLHTHLVQPFQVKLSRQELWQRVGNYALPGETPIFGLEPVALLSHHLLHLNRHGFRPVSPLQWTTDFLFLVNQVQQQGKWTEFRAVLRKWEIQTGFDLTVLMLQRRLPAMLMDYLPSPLENISARNLRSIFLPRYGKFFRPVPLGRAHGLLLKFVFARSWGAGGRAVADWLGESLGF